MQQRLLRLGVTLLTQILIAAIALAIFAYGVLRIRSGGLLDSNALIQSALLAETAPKTRLPADLTLPIIGQQMGVVWLHSHDGEGLGIGFFVDTPKGQRFITPTHVLENMNVDNVDIFAVDRAKKPSDQVRTYRYVRRYDDGRGTSVLILDHHHIIDRPRVLTPKDATINQQLTFLLAGTAAAPERMFKKESDNLSASLVGHLTGRPIIFCSRCKPGDSGTPLYNPHAQIAGYIEAGLFGLFFQSKSLLPETPKNRPIVFTPASRILAAIKESELH